jgi:hypothetical protein
VDLVQPVLELVVQDPGEIVRHGLAEPVAMARSASGMMGPTSSPAGFKPV